MAVKLRKKTATGGRMSLYLDTIHENQRKKEYLKLYVFKRPKNPLETQHNQETMRLAESIRAKRELELNAAGHGVQVSFKKNIDFIKYFEKYTAEYNKKNLRVVKACLKTFKVYIGKPSIRATEVTPRLCEKFKEYLDLNLAGESPSTYFARFKGVVKQAFKEGHFARNPVEDIKNTRQESLRKDVLTIEEIQALAKAPCNNDQVKRSFLLACYSGLRLVDIRNLEWSNINGNILTFVQTKTEKKSPHKVHLNLNSISMQLLGESKQFHESVFDLPSHTSVLKSLKKWAKDAGVQKHVTFHVARHSFATNLLFYQTDLMTVASLLGHTSTQHTQKYVRVADSMKQQAISRLPEVEL
ncbi:site-specific integrase [Cytophagaceae bacterium YF14B1]|uniref:Site-specific integrase n=1 Tax=Xanthocytophaga flava TaxID=3048013 RepID=A0AAE3QVE1_9BACT|nr:site-specific integrase [Xanthocytophaga flavus]MDJ1483504.1 site-specific integrase [Xanthocytophaga flavus]